MGESLHTWSGIDEPGDLTSPEGVTVHSLHIVARHDTEVARATLECLEKFLVGVVVGVDNCAGPTSV